MPNFSIKDVPERWANALRQRAERNHRSLQGELMAILERASTEAGADIVMAVDRADDPVVGRRSPAHSFSRTARTPFESARSKRGSKTVEQLYTEHVARFPAPIAAVPGMRSVDLVREDRDAR